jgi:hypothetical protein
MSCAWPELWGGVLAAFDSHVKSLPGLIPFGLGLDCFPFIKGAVRDEKTVPLKPSKFAVVSNLEVNPWKMTALT